MTSINPGRRDKDTHKPDIHCPATACPVPVDLATCTWLLLTSKNQATLDKYLAKQTKKLSLARCTNCKRFGPRGGKGRCSCGTPLCTSCGEVAHWPASCTEFGLSLQLEASQLWKIWTIEVDVRACPGCGELWEKTYDYHHMACGRCRISFCWGCGKKASNHCGGLCGEITVPLEIKKIYSFTDFDGFTNNRLSALEVGIKRRTWETEKVMNPRQLVHEALARYESRLCFHHTRRGRRDLERMQVFIRLEERLGQAVEMARRGREMVKFGYFLEQSEALETRRLLEQLEAVVGWLEQWVAMTRAVEVWEPRMVNLTADVRKIMLKICVVLDITI